MAQIAVSPIRLSNVKLNIKNGATDVGDFEKHVSEVLLTPTTPTTSWTGLGANVHQFVGTTTWQASLAHAQDWSTANSLSQYLLDHEGEQVVMTFTPGGGTISATNPAFRCTVTLVPGQIGGAVDAVATSPVTLPVTGKPAKITTAA